MSFGRKKEEQKEVKVAVSAPTTDVEKFKALFAIGKAFDKKHDTTNSLLRLGSKNVVPVAVIPTGLPTLDFGALECGGIPRGRMIELYGPESSGKTTFALHMVAQEQALGGICAFVDTEHALDPVYAQTLGVDTDNLMVSQPNSGEQALEMVENVTGDAQAHCEVRRKQSDYPLDKSNQGENWSALRQPRNHNGWTCFEVLRQCAYRRTSQGSDHLWQQRKYYWPPGEIKNSKEQVRSALPRGYSQSHLPRH